MKKIPFDPDSASSQQFRVDVGGKVLTLYLAWNIRDAAWYMDIADGQYGIKLVPYSRLVVRDDLLGITGNFVLLKDNDAASDIISYGMLGSDYNLYWLDSDDIASLADG